MRPASSGGSIRPSFFATKSRTSTIWQHESKPAINSSDVYQVHRFLKNTDLTCVARNTTHILRHIDTDLFSRRRIDSNIEAPRSHSFNDL